MGQTVSGISSGLDTETIIKGLMSIKRARVDKLTAQKEKETAKTDTWTTISSSLLGLQLSSYALSKSSTYNTRLATVSNKDLMTVSASSSAVAGSYNFYVKQLASSHQLSTNGFFDYDTTKVGAGSISLELGDGDVRKQTDLNTLNGGDGITRGTIKITNRDGVSANIDLTQAMTVDDVLNAINNASLSGITASVNATGTGINIAYSGVGAQDLKVEDINGGTTALDLGIKQTVAGNTVSGTSIHYLMASDNLSNINDGLGLTKQSFFINDGVHGDKAIILTSVNKIQDVIDTINAAGTDVTAALSSDGRGLSLTSAGAFTVTENGYNSAKELGILNLTSTGDGDKLIAGMNSVLLKNINGGAGITGNSFNIGATTINIAGKQSLSEVIDAINTQSGVTNVMARFNSAKNGLELYSTNSSSFTVTEDGSSTAQSLGILGASTSYVKKGSDLDFAYIGKNVVLSKINQGTGVRAGTISITNKNGSKIDINLTLSSIKTVGDVISTINNVGSAYNISASINTTGDGIIINDASGGSGNLIIADANNGHMAEDLGIEGTTSGTSYNGSFEKTITVGVDYTLEDVRDAINELGIEATASIVNDGSTNPYRLVLTSKNTGRANRMLFDTDIASLNMKTAVEAKDAVLIMGDPSSENAIFKSNSSNSVNNFISGVTLNLKETSSTAETLTVENDAETVVTSIKDFVEKFNKSVALINTQLTYNSDTESVEPLFGDTNIMMIQQQVYNMITRSVSGLSGTITTASQVGISMALDGQLSFSESTLRTVMSSSPDEVQDFFTFENNTSLAATATSSGVDAPWTVNGAKDGNSKLADYADGSTGWQANNGAYYQLDFGALKDLTSLKILGVDTTSSDVLKSYDVQYWDSLSGAWSTYRSVSASTAKDNFIYFPSGLVTNKIRLFNMQGTGTKAKLLDLQAYETVGMAGAMELGLSKITSASTGVVSSALDGIDENQSVLDDEIASQEERLAQEEARLRKQFTQLESMMSNLKQSSSAFASQLEGINASWKSS